MTTREVFEILGSPHNIYGSGSMYFYWECDNGQSVAVYFTAPEDAIEQKGGWAFIEDGTAFLFYISS